MRLLYLVFFLGTTAWAAPCSDRAGSLVSAIECAKENEPAFRSTLSAAEEGRLLKSSAYRLINPALELETIDGTFLGTVQRETNASLLFTFELGGKRSAREKILEAEGLILKADAFDQAVNALTDLGGSILRLHQLRFEKSVLEESIESFRKVISLYRSRGALPPEQRVSLNTFELILIGYEKKLIDVETEELRFRKRVETVFGTNAAGASFDLKNWDFNEAQYQSSFDAWIGRTPEMMRAKSVGLRADGEHALASALAWPDLSIGPTVSQITQGPSDYTAYGLKLSFPVPLLSWNGAERGSKKLTSVRKNAQVGWEQGDVRTKYQSLIHSMTRMKKVLRDGLSAEQIQKSHHSTESLYQRGMVSGALMIEAHRALIEHFEIKNALQMEYLKGFLTLKLLNESAGL